MRPMFQNAPFVIVSMGVLDQRDVSPTLYKHFKICIKYKYGPQNAHQVAMQ